MYLYGQWNGIIVGQITVLDIYKWTREPSNCHKLMHTPETIIRHAPTLSHPAYHHNGDYTSNRACSLRLSAFTPTKVIAYISVHNKTKAE